MTDKIDDETRAFKDEMRKLGLTAKGMLAFEKYAAEAERYREPSKDFGKLAEHWSWSGKSSKMKMMRFR